MPIIDGLPNLKIVIFHSYVSLPEGIANWWIFSTIHWLVVWNMIFFSPYIGNFIIPTDFHSYFSDGLVETTNQFIIPLVIS